ncbi:MAG TPA: winged helix-turn-helix domain-containing protein, partial [Chloroflexota bacterium]|nr:winged helix-turn-helix domain-containing protein [Chloroflexota bacterium]
YLADVPDPVTREVLEAASLVRRSTQSLLRAMLAHRAPQDSYERLRTLPFVQSGRDGLIVHDLVREAVAAALCTADPSRRQTYRQAAWRQLSMEAQSASRSDLWRYTADLIYMIENPIIRDAFFPHGAHLYAVAQARSDDGSAIEAIAARHEGQDTIAHVMKWWSQAPQIFRTVRDGHEVVVGFSGYFQPTAVHESYIRHDPIYGLWWQHLQYFPVAAQEKILFTLRFLGRDDGDAPSPVRAAHMLDLKGQYMQLRPQLRRIYVLARELGPFARQLGFQVIPEGTVKLDGIRYDSMVLDFGPASVDGWLAGLMSAELGKDSDILLDQGAHELVVDGQRTALTRLEFGVMDYFSQHEGKVATRAALVANVWGYADSGGSNVVDVVVRSLRQKLGVRASAIETVTGAGYRFKISGG